MVAQTWSHKRGVAADARRFLALVLSVGAGTSIVAPTASASSSTTASNPSSFSWHMTRQGDRVMAMCEDLRGRVWVSSEENGVWMREPQGTWTHFTPQNSGIASDMVYALAVDKQGRVWAGTARHGVSVFNGKTWKNYNALQAPVGERIFDITLHPLDGSVWIASNIGLTRYSPQRDRWTTLYPASRLPFNHLQSLAFSKKGTLFAASQTTGLFVAQPYTTRPYTAKLQKNTRRNAQKRAQDGIEYSTWRNVQAPRTLPDTANGTGLPSMTLPPKSMSVRGGVLR